MALKLIYQSGPDQPCRAAKPSGFPEFSECIEGTIWSLTAQPANRVTELVQDVLSEKAVKLRPEALREIIQSECSSGYRRSVNSR